jgi:hypothetical protein
MSNNWQSWQPVDEDLNSLLQPAALHKLHTHHPLMKLRKSLQINSAWGILITIGYIGVMFITKEWPVILAMLILLVFNSFVIGAGWQLYKNINPYVSGTISLRQEMERHYHSIMQWQNMQMKLSLIIFPVAVTGGFILGGSIGSGKSFDEFIFHAKILWALLICLVIIVPACYWLAKWMFKQAFGKHLDVLKQTIDELKKED